MHCSFGSAIGRTLSGSILLTALVVSSGACAGSSAEAAFGTNGTEFERLAQSVSALSATDVWVAGLRKHLGTSPTFPWIEHYDGTSWTKAVLPELHSSLSEITDIHALAADDVWAVGFTRDKSDHSLDELILHWDGQVWSRVAGAGPASNGIWLEAVTASGPDDVWAAGEYELEGTAKGLLVEHWDGSAWSLTDNPVHPSESGDLYDITALDAEVWAVGQYSGDDGRQAVTERFAAGGWTSTEVPSPVDKEFVGVDGTSSSDIWAVGDINEVYRHPYIEHWNGVAWHKVHSPFVRKGNGLTSVAAVAPDDAWAVGIAGYWHRPQPLLEHWDGTSWTFADSAPLNHHAYFDDADAVASDDVWVVGRVMATQYKYRPLVEHWDGTEWVALQH